MSRFRLFLFIAMMLLFCASEPNLAFAESAVQQFGTEQTAQQHCPADTVVWVNTKTEVYHFKGQSWYGNTKAGTYVCKQEADKGGYQATRNGQ